jgi:polar amino acid transport system substrate-binding protein
LYNENVKIKKGESVVKRILATLVCILTVVMSLASCKNTTNDLKCIDIHLTSEEYAFAVNKNDDELLNEANELLNTIKADGTLDTIINKYFSNDISKIKTFDGGEELPCKEQLVVATHLPFSPFEYMIGDRYCGIDMEIAGLLAKKLDRELVIKEYGFDEIISAVENEEADIVMAALTVSNDRLEKIAFTNSYFEASQIIVSKKTDTTFDNCKTTDDVVNILKKMNKSTKIGYQKDTVSGYYVCGNQKMGFIGFNTSNIGYNSAYDAAKDLKNGKLDYIIVDSGPAKMIVNQLNQEK